MDNNRYLQIDKNKIDAVYLGYDMGLTKAEYCILYCIMKSQAPIFPKDILLSSKESLFLSSSVPMLVSKINKKAVSIGGRKIIGCEKGKGYFINQYI